MALCRDVFTHFCQPEIIRTVNNLKLAGTRYLAASRYQPGEINPKLAQSTKVAFNANALPGYWRPSNLLMPPFSFPQPLWTLPENQPGKFLDIWRLQDIPMLPPAPELRKRTHDPVSTEDFLAYAFFRQLCALPFVREIRLFGSRAKGMHRVDSDIDLYLICDSGMAREDWLKVCDIIEQADIPLGIDCARYDDGFVAMVKHYEWPITDRILYERTR
jgi:hypothetical protein